MAALQEQCSGESTMLFVRGVVFLSSGLLLGGCMQSVPVSDANFTARDKRQLANAPYQRAFISPAYQRQIVPYHRKETQSSILVDTAGRYVFFVLPGGKAVSSSAMNRSNRNRPCAVSSVA